MWRSSGIPVLLADHVLARLGLEGCVELLNLRECLTSQGFLRSDDFSFAVAEFEAECNRLPHHTVHSTGLMLLRCCSKHIPLVVPKQRIAFAERIIQMLKKLKVANIRHYNMLLKVCIENRQPLSSTEFLKLLQSVNVVANQETYELLILKQCIDLDLMAATEILALMTQQNIAVRRPAFNALLLGYAKEKNLAAVKTVLKLMKDSVVSLDFTSFYALVQGSAEAGNNMGIRLALRYFFRSISMLENPEVSAYILQSLGLNGHFELMKNIVRLLPPNDPRVDLAKKRVALNLVSHDAVDSALIVFASISNKNPVFVRALAFHLLSKNKPSALKEFLLLINDKFYCHDFLCAHIKLAFDQNKMVTAFELLKIFWEVFGSVKPQLCWPLLKFYASANHEKELTAVRLWMATAGISDYDSEGLWSMHTTQKAADISSRDAEVHQCFASERAETAFSWSSQIPMHVDERQAADYARQLAETSSFEGSLSLHQIQDEEASSFVTHRSQTISSQSCPVNSLPVETISVSGVTQQRTVDVGVLPHLNKLFEGQSPIAAKRLLFENLRRGVCLPYLESLGTLVNMFVERSDILGALDCFMDALTEFECVPFADSLLKHLVASESTFALNQVLGALKSYYGEGYATIVHAVSVLKCGRLSAAEQILRNVKEPIGASLTEFTGRLAAENEEEIIKILLSMTKRLASVTDRQFMYAHLMQVHRNTGDWRSGLDTWANMQDECLPPSDTTMTILAELLSANGQKVPFLYIVTPTTATSGDSKKTAFDSESRKIEGQRRAVSTSTTATACLEQWPLAFDPVELPSQVDDLLRPSRKHDLEVLLKDLVKLDEVAHCLVREKKESSLRQLLSSSAARPFPAARQLMYSHVMQLHYNNSDWRTGLETWTDMQDENLVPSDATLKTLAYLMLSCNQTPPFKVPDESNALAASF